jgi:glutaredoxin
VTHRFRSIAIIGSVLAALALASAPTQAQQVYRYVDKDGKIVYSDRAPPSDSKDVQAKRLTPNYIESSPANLATTQAQQRFPVTLYTFDCGEFCRSAEALLNRRGVPFTTVNVADPKGAEQLKRLTGEMNAPVLQVGDNLKHVGFNEPRWNALLDEAGYPKTPPSRRASPTRPPGEAAPSSPPAPIQQKSEASGPAPPAGNYPKN